MGCRWFFYNENLDQYYSTGSDDLINIGSDLKEIFQIYKWEYEDKISIVNDCNFEIDRSKIIN